MQKYYPVLSIVAAVLFLLLPFAILSRSSSKAKPPEPAESTAGISQPELRELKEQLTQISAKLPQLERAMADLRTSNDLPADQRPTDRAEVSRDATASGNSASNPRNAISRDAQRFAASQVSDPHLEKIDQRVEQLTRQLADFLAAQNSTERQVPEPQAVASTGAAAGPPTASDLAAVSPGMPAAAPKTAPQIVEKHPTPEEMVLGTDGHAMLAPVEELTAGELSKEATKNLRDRAGVDDPIDVDAPEKDLVEIILQTPKDGMTVNRVEQLYAQSREPGWPVVLVRSSFDDEEWWAQPISGRRGTQILSRVHFGNDSTPRGSAFTMVILLLDGYEEAVRFRTARRFTKIPPGIRRSREFMFVLK